MKKISEFFQMIKGHLSPGRRLEAISSADRFNAFLATRSAFIAQKTLYGYVKTRMGMKYPEMFENDVFIASLNIAKWQVYAACLSDLAAFMAARVAAVTGNEKEARAIALDAFDVVLADRFSDPEFTGDRGQLAQAFADRLALIDWNHAAAGEGAFKESPRALIRWAPIDDELKKLDKEIVMNSIRFQWQRIRGDFEKAFDADGFLEDWRSSRR